MATDVVRSEGADLVYDHEGSGPPLLLIAGGGGDMHRYADISALLADEYTVVRYDRRGYGRSTEGAEPEFDMAQQVRDAAAIVGALGDQAYVFGNSAGANIGLALVADKPELVTALVAHEPPVMGLLPDADVWLKLVDDVHSTYLADGFGPAMRMFTGSMTGMSQFAAPRRSAGASADVVRNLDRFMSHEYYSMSKYVPDLGALAAAGRPIIMAAGRDSLDAYYARTARLLAERLDLKYVEFPGHHLAFQSEPEAFAASLRAALHSS